MSGTLVLTDIYKDINGYLYETNASDEWRPRYRTRRGTHAGGYASYCGGRTPRTDKLFDNPGRGSKVEAQGILFRLSANPNGHCWVKHKANSDIVGQKAIQGGNAVQNVKQWGHCLGTVQVQRRIFG